MGSSGSDSVNDGEVLMPYLTLPASINTSITSIVEITNPCSNLEDDTSATEVVPQTDIFRRIDCAVLKNIPNLEVPVL